MVTTTQFGAALGDCEDVPAIPFQLQGDRGLEGEHLRRGFAKLGAQNVLLLDHCAEAGLDPLVSSRELVVGHDLEPGAFEERP